MTLQPLWLPSTSGWTQKTSNSQTMTAEAYSNFTVCSHHSYHQKKTLHPNFLVVFFTIKLSLIESDSTSIGFYFLIFVYTGTGSGLPPVTPHTPYNPQPTHSPDRPRFGPNICEGHFDTIAILRGEMFVFKVKHSPGVLPEWHEPLFFCRVEDNLFLVFFTVCRTSGSGECVTTTCWTDTPCQLVTSGGVCPLISMLLLKGKMGNLLSLKVSHFRRRGFVMFCSCLCVSLSLISISLNVCRGQVLGFQ